MPNIIPEVVINMNWVTPDKRYKQLLAKSYTNVLNIDETKELTAFIKSAPNI